MKPVAKLCGKVIHATEEEAEAHKASLEDRQGAAPNVYLCWRCSEVLNRDVWHTGYLDIEGKLSKKSRRIRKEVKAKRTKRAPAQRGYRRHGRRLDDDSWPGGKPHGGGSRNGWTK